LLTITNLSKTYPNGVQALKNITLEIGSGMYGLLGPNGAGKSSLMRTIAALQEPDSGHILLDGVDVVRDPQAVREKLGYLPQEFGVYPKISALDLLDHMALLKGIHNKSDRREQVTALLQQTNLFDARKKAVGSFSGGMKQRFGIAQALLADPRLIIVDEPTAGLDPEERNRFHNLLAEVGENRVVILSTHIVEDVRDLCSNMAVLVGGEVMLQGEPDALVNQLKGKVWSKSVSRSQLDEANASFAILSKRLVSGRLKIHVLADERPGADFEMAETSLEDVYFSVLLQQRDASVC
jgi:ABC-type multidrug transport system ATPase subunit